MPTGVIITNGLRWKGTVFHMALDVEQRYQNVHEFRLTPINSTQIKTFMKPSNDFKERDLVAEQRRVHQSMIYGDVIQWDEFDSEGRRVGIVNKFKRLPKIYDTRIRDGVMQMKLQGIMSRNRKVMWMLDMWPDLSIPHALKNSSHPDVAVYVWVQLQINDNQTLAYQLESIEGFAETYQHLVVQAKWNKSDHSPTNLPQFYDPVADNRIAPEFVVPLSCTITGMQGVVISEKMILPLEEKHRDTCFHRCAINDEVEFPDVGNVVTFNAEKIDFLNIYAITAITKIGVDKKYPVQNNMIKATIRYQPDLPGFYFCPLLNIFVDDPENILETWLLSQYTKSTLQVSIGASEPSVKGVPRYTVTAITDAKSKKLQALRESGELHLKDELAIVTEYCKLFLPNYPKFRMRLPKDSKTYQPGTIVRVSAQLLKKWNITSVEVDRKMAPVSVSYQFDETADYETIFFKVPEARGNRQLPFLLQSPLFGFIQPSNRHKIRKNPDTEHHYDFWVSLNDCHAGDIFQPPAKFKFCHAGAVEIRGCENVRPERSDQDVIQGRNEWNVPEIPRYDTIGPNSSQDVPQMLQSLYSNQQWQTNATALVDRTVNEHLKTCEACSNRQHSQCIYPEFFAKLLQDNPDVADVFYNTGILTFIAVRNYHQ